MEAGAVAERKVYTVAAFNRGVADWLGRLPTVWVEGEVTELRRHPNWQSVFFTLKDPSDGACLSVTMPRGQFDAHEHGEDRFFVVVVHLNLGDVRPFAGDEVNDRIGESDVVGAHGGNDDLHGYRTIAE